MSNGGEASELVHMVLQGGEVAIRLGASVVKNIFAFFMAMRQNNKVIYGKRSVRKLMKNFKDIRTFTMTKEQFKSFRKKARKYKFPFAGIGDRKNKNGNIDLLLPQEYIEPANLVFEKVGYKPPAAKDIAKSQKEVKDKKKERQPTQNSRDTKAKSTTREASSSTSKTRMNDAGKTKTADKPSVEGKLLQFHKQAKTKQAVRPKARVRAKAKGPKR